MSEKEKMLPSQAQSLSALSVNSFAPARTGSFVTCLDDVERIAKLAVASKFFKNAEDVSKAVMVMLWGLEHDMSPTRALNDVYFINGKFALYARALSEEIHRVPGLYIKTLEHTTQRCELALIYRDQEVGRESFSMDDAQRMGLTRNPVYKNDPKSMLYARCVSVLHYHHAMRFTRMNVYTVEEMEDAAKPVESAAATDPVPVDNLDHMIERAKKKGGENDVVTKEMMLALYKSAEANQGMSKKDVTAFVGEFYKEQAPDGESLTPDNFKELFTCGMYWRCLEKLNGPRFHGVEVTV